MRRLATSIALTLAAAPAGALACTPAPGYHVPTNIELAGRANLIVLGEVVAAGQGTALDPVASTVTIHPLAALKGLLPGADIVLAGMSLAEPGDPIANALSDPLAFGDPHPQALTGACIRRAFPLGARAVFFLRRENGQWVPAGGPFSRWQKTFRAPRRRGSPSPTSTPRLRCCRPNRGARSSRSRTPRWPAIRTIRVRWR